MQSVDRQISRVADTDAAVLLVGESGTGKEVVARAVHRRSRRRDGPFVPVNCGAIPAALIEAELFGHERGSYTGAHQQQSGYFEHAAGGTLFLDEITEMAPDMQVKLLRVLETGGFHRVGGIEELKADVRVISATNREPAQALADGVIREDLLYRLAAFPIRVPALRERYEDIAPLARHFLDEFNESAGTAKTFSAEALENLQQRSWSGNVRELRNTIYRAHILADAVIGPDVLQDGPPRKHRKPEVSSGKVQVWVGTPLAEAQRELILATLAKCDGDKRKTANALGISLKTLYNRLALYESPQETGSVSSTEP